MNIEVRNMFLETTVYGMLFRGALLCEYKQMCEKMEDFAYFYGY